MSKSDFTGVLFDEVKTIEDGKYEGKITEIKRDNETYDYTRYKVNISSEDMDLSLSFPTKISFLENGKPSTQHAKFLDVMGIEFVKGKDAAESIFSLVGKEISFLVNNVKKDQGTFVEIVKKSVKPKA